MKYQRIALVNPPLSEGVVKCIDDGFWQPLNLLTLASYLQSMEYRGEIKIFDQAVMPEDEINEGLELFKPDLLGLSPNVDSYEQALKIAERAKEFGADVVMGGAYATKLSENILNNRKYVDFIITNEGEKALWELARGAYIETIPNLVYRRSGDICSNDVELCCLASLCEIDYSLVNMEDYFRNYSKSLNPGRYKRPATILTQRGCVWREKTDGCIFCSRINHNAVFDNPGNVWKRIEKLKIDYNIDCVIDVGDDFLGSKDWFYSFYESRPNSLKNIGVRFIYSRVEHINEETADMLRELNVSEICLGFESGDREILKRVRKGNTPEQHIRAVKLLGNRGIKLISAFMLGHPGESKASLDRTMRHIVEILEHNNTNELVVSIFTPLSGSIAYNMLLESNNEFSATNRNNDKFHVRNFQEEWIKNFCSVDFNVLQEYADKLNNLFRNTYIEFA